MKLTLDGQMDLLAEMTDMPWYQDVKTIPFKLQEIEDLHGPVIRLRVRGDEITDGDMRAIKHVFGPLEFSNEYGTTNGRGEVSTEYLPDMPAITVAVTVSGALSCTADLPGDNGASPEQIRKLIQQFEAGEIHLQTCTSLKHIDPDEICKNRHCRGVAMREGYCYECYANAQNEFAKREATERVSMLKS
jgi:hypothetical protein